MHKIAAFRETIGTLLPFYETSLDASDWTATVLVQWIVAMIAFSSTHSPVVTLNTVQVDNKRLNDLKNDGEAYPMDYDPMTVINVVRPMFVVISSRLLQRMKFIRDNFRDLPGLARCFEIIKAGRSCVPRPFGRHDQEYIEYLRHFEALRNAETRALGREPRQWGSIHALMDELRPEGELYRVLKRWSKLPLAKRTDLFSS